MIKLDLHTHFDHTRSMETNARHISNVSIDGLAICSFRDLELVKKLRDKIKNKIIIVGQELFTVPFHILGLGLEKSIHHRMPAEDTIAEIHSQGGIAVAAHPVIGVKNPWRLLRYLQEYQFDAIEGHNSILGPFLIPNLIARRLAKLTNVPAISTSDAHRLKYIGCSYIELPCGNDNNDMRTIFRLIKEGQFTTTNKSYINFHQYTRSLRGRRCRICGSKLIFRQEFSDMRCHGCNKVERSNLYCPNGHYLCERCYFGID